MAVLSKQIIKRKLAGVAKILVRIGILPDRVILKTDGGICSQMHFYLVGKMIELNTGHKVTYDLDWYKTCGTDCDGRFARNFDLLRIFPTLGFIEEKSRIIKRIYISLFYKRSRYLSDDPDNHDWQTSEAPCYLDGYFHDPEEMYAHLFRDTFKVSTDVLPDDNKEARDMILDSNEKYDTCAIHIRRGDLTREHPVYGIPASLEYFLESIRLISDRSKQVRFYIFSDEPEWCRRKLIPQIGSHHTTVVDINGSDRGWCDLILMSLCHHQITSHGSMGKYAAMLREDKNTDGLVTLPDSGSSEEWEKRFKLSITVRTANK